MDQRYWLIPKDRVRLLSAIMRALAGNSYIIFEGEIPPSEFHGLVTSESFAFPSFGRESRESSYMVVIPLEAETIDPILTIVLPNDRFIDEIGAIQIWSKGDVQFMSGDNFHEE